MTRGCKVCHKIESINPEVTFHRIPPNPEKRKSWFALLDFNPAKVLPKSAFICSDHFEKRHFHYKKNGLRYLNSDANPRPVRPEVFQPQTSLDLPFTMSNFGSFSDDDSSKQKSESKRTLQEELDNESYKSLVFVKKLEATKDDEKRHQKVHGTVSSCTDEDPLFVKTHCNFNLETKVDSDSCDFDNESSDIEMEEEFSIDEYHQIFIKCEETKVECSDEIDEKLSISHKMINSSMSETENNTYSIKKEDESYICSDDCKFDLEIETKTEEYCCADSVKANCLDHSSEPVRNLTAIKTIIKMEGHDYHQIAIKTEEEDSAENGDCHVICGVSERSEDGNEEGLLFSNECKLEMDFDEFSNEDARAIYFKECNSSMIKSEKTSQLTLESETDSDIQIEDACNKISSYKIDVSDHSKKYGCNSAHELKHVTTPKVKSIIHERQLESNKDQANKNQNEEFMNEIESKFRIEVETYDKFDHTYAKPIYRNKINTADNNTVRGKDSVNKNQFDYMKQSCGKGSIQTEAEENLLEHNRYLHTTESAFKCDKFSDQTKIKSRLQQHQLVHQEERPFKCDKCDYAGQNKTHLKLHQTRHSHVKLYKCDKCPFKTLFESRMQQHELAHQCPFKCYKCDYSAKTKAHLKQHETTHSAMEPFKCDECPYQTLIINTFRYHKLAHMDQKPFKCNKCNYSTNRRTFLVQHKKTHSKGEPFRCHECSFETKKIRCLYHHRQVHREDGVFKCDKCSYQTVIESHFQQHQLLHTNEMPFKCDDKCDYYAKSNVLLKHHQTTQLAIVSEPEGLDCNQDYY